MRRILLENEGFIAEARVANFDIFHIFLAAINNAYILDINHYP